MSKPMQKYIPEKPIPDLKGRISNLKLEASNILPEITQKVRETSRSEPTTTKTTESISTTAEAPIEFKPKYSRTQQCKNILQTVKK